MCARAVLACKKGEESNHETINTGFRNPVDVRRSFVCAGGGYYEVGRNYSWLHVNSANFDFQRTGNAGSEYFEYNLNRTIGLVGDFGGYANTRTGINDKALTYLFGPRFNWRHSRLNPCFATSLMRSPHLQRHRDGRANAPSGRNTTNARAIDFGLDRATRSGPRILVIV